MANYRRGIEQLEARRAHNPEAVGSNPAPATNLGPMVKRLRHRPFTAITRVRVPVGSFIFYGSLAQLGEHLPYKQRVIGSSPIVSTDVLTPLFRVFS